MMVLPKIVCDRQPTEHIVAGQGSKRINGNDAFTLIGLKTLK